MKITFGKDVYNIFKDGLSIGDNNTGLVTFTVADTEEWDLELTAILGLLRENGCDALIHFGEDEK